ncbi:hypothetical protein AB0D27_02085 [Streptomyces sp. NPDC048415]|uniref:hypothetical protein n=1 Tax=Streptomyces sp. NPDC048415 TaxID=3154822 RepID=UPI00343023D1
MRWSIQVTFTEARGPLGAGQAHNRTRAAVERTVPFGLYGYTITVAWYALHGHHPAMMPASAASAHPGTPPRPTRRCPTWSPSSAE